MRPVVFVQVLVYLFAFFLFYVGLFLGLQVSTKLGNIAVVSSFLVAVANTWWVGRSSRKKGS